MRTIDNRPYGQTLPNCDRSSGCLNGGCRGNYQSPARAKCGTLQLVMKMTELPSRKPNRLKDYDYSQNGCYFITICVKDRRNILWKPSTDNVEAIINHPLSKYGEVVERAIAQIPNHYECVNVDKHIIMPNHIHMIITISNNRPYSTHNRTYGTCKHPYGIHNC